MFRKATAFALTLAVATAIPQGLPPGIENLPDCALNGLPAVLAASGCPGIDVDCLCSKPDLPSQLDSAVNDACDNEADRETIRNFVAGFCPPASSSSEAAPETTTPPPESTSAMPTEEMTSTTTMPMTTTMSNESTTMTMPTSATSTIVYTNGTNGTSPTYNSPSPSESSPPASEGAAGHYGVSLFAFVVAMGGMTWAFAEF